ncbi:MAG: tripartite tricarboxylate transporter substrate binding protein [Herminiimonas sp.]|nr:tripartite tricarboxylate transporter substrate binding protein [Herminiimonas sp.]
MKALPLKAALEFVPARLLARVAGAALGAAVLALSASSAAAEDYPSRAVKIIVPFAAGGPADIYARFVAQHLGESLKQAFIVEDRPGGGSLLGTEAVAKSPPDGYTLLLMSNTHTVNESLFTKKPFDLMRDFAPVAPINYSDLVLVTKPGLAVTNLADLLKLAKSQPEGLTYASSGPGTPYHMAGELFKSMAGVKILHVPYRGSSGARTDVLGGQVDMMFDAVPTMADFIRTGKVKAIGTTGKTRSTVLPNVPTVSESGVPGYEAVIWLGLMAPKGTPPEIVKRLNDEVTKMASDPKVIEAWAKQGAIPMKMTPAQFSKYVADDITKWAHIVKISGAKADQ